MSEEFGPDFITITDEDGNDFELEHVETIEYNGQVYMAFFPAETDEEDNEKEEEENGLIILKVIIENGEEQLSTLDSEEELQEVYDEMMKVLFAEDEEEPEGN